MIVRSHAPTWQLQEAKNKLSAVVDAAATAPQTITRHGKPVAVLVSVADWEQLTPPGRQEPRTGLELLRPPGIAYNDDLCKILAIIDAENRARPPEPPPDFG